jgi:transposase-like protein
MTKAYSIAFKQKMVERLTGKNAVNSSQLAREIGIRQQNLSRWLHAARGLLRLAIGHAALASAHGLKKLRLRCVPSVSARCLRKRLVLDSMCDEDDCNA